jgi:hypothetical protein
MKTIQRVALRLAALGLTAALVSACGGGSEEPSAFDRHDISPAGVITAKAGEHVNISVESQVYGEEASIEAQGWSATLQGNASGDVSFSDPDCALARKVTRDVNQSKVVNWQCSATVVATAGSKGDFLLTAVATDGSGNTERASVTLRVVP